MTELQRSAARYARILAPALPLLAYAALSAGFFAANVSWQTYIFGYTQDPISFVWFLNWWVHAAQHGLNPFLCDYVWSPEGVNMTWETSVPALAYAMFPITAKFGAVLSYNLLTLAAPALAAWTACLLEFELTGSWPAAAVCGYLFGFSPYEMTTIQSALNLDTILLVPAVFLICIRYVRGRMHPRRFVVLLAIVLSVQLGISTEVLCTVSLIGAVTWLLALAFATPALRRALYRLSPALCGVAVLTGLISAPFLYYLVAGFSKVPPIINSPELDSANLISFLVPSRPFLQGLLSGFAGFSPSRAPYVGPAELLLCLAAVSFGWADRTLRAVAAATVLAALFSLGPRLHVTGQAAASLTLPWSLALHVPIVRQVLPGRLVMYVSLGCAIIAAHFLSAKASLWRYALAALTIATLVPVRPTVLPKPWTYQPPFTLHDAFYWTPWPTLPSHFPDFATRDPPPVVAIFPSATQSPAMAWQVDSGMSFKQVGGYVGFAPIAQRAFTPLYDDFAPADAGLMRRLIATLKPSVVLVTPAARRDEIDALRQPQWPEATLADGLSLYEVPPAGAAGGD